VKRIAFFVEGLTEQLFIEKLLIEILGEMNVSIETRKMQGGSKTNIKITQIGSPKINQDADYYFLITDCGSETTVASYIKEQRDSLKRSGYIALFGMLDVRPNWKRDQIPELNRKLYCRMPQRDLETKFILSIMEIEAWFLAEENHYEKIDANLTLDYIQNNHGIDPRGNTELIDEPADLLDKIYQSVGQKYGKNKQVISKTVELLDYTNLYFEVSERIPSLKNLIDSIDKHFE
jgi:hypothetical protein